jgi:hypothetical protein
MSALLRANGFEQPDDIINALPPGLMPHRQFWLNDYVQGWIKNTLPGVPPDWGAEAPIGQVMALFAKFIIGDHLALPPGARFADLHIMEPQSHSVWNARSVDARFYGWFLERDVFLCVNAMTKATALQVSQTGVVEQVVHKRNAMPAQLRGVQTGSGYQDVLSDRV